MQLSCKSVEIKLLLSNYSRDQESLLVFQVVLFSTKRKPLARPPLYLGGTLLTEVLQHRHLGIILTPNLSWTAHIEMIVTKAL